MELGAVPKARAKREEESTMDTRGRRVEEEEASLNTREERVEEETATSISCLPDEVLEYILSLLSPYADMENCALTCSRWLSCCQRVAAQHLQHFWAGLGRAGLVWSCLPGEEAGGGVSKRYSHCAVYCPQRSSMFVFGGCTSTSSTFNDLWELNLSTRSWHRPLSVGAYPSPKACASLVRHDDTLLLFGGWTHPSLYPLHQSWKLFSELHIYSIPENRWELVASEERPPAMAGHSATLHAGAMVVYGGLHKQRSVGHYTSSSDVWTFQLESRRWSLQHVAGAAPLPRYGQSQIWLGASHLLVLGGCGGPNTEYSDVWLLDMATQPWTWVQMEVRGEEHRARDIWSHPACRVGERVVVLGKARREEAPAAWPGAPAARRGVPRAQGSRRTSAPAPHHRRQDISSSDSDLELSVEPVPPRAPGPPFRPSYRTTLSLSVGGAPSPRPPAHPGPPGPSPPPPSPLPPSNPASAPNALIPVKVTPAHAKAFGPAANTGTQDPSLAAPSVSGAGLGPSHPRPPGGPGNPEPSRQVTLAAKNRQKMLENRQRQLASLQRMEERIRSTGSSPFTAPRTSAPSCPHHRLALHILDISRAVSERWVEWEAVPHPAGAGPQEAILYSLVLGRRELVMFGGLQKDVSLGVSPAAETVSNSLHFLNPPLQPI